MSFDDLLALADAIEDGDDHGDLRGETEAFAEVRVVAGVGFVGVIDGEERDSRA